MIVSRYFIYFLIGSFLGWIWESIFCTTYNKKWENRGFLFGPICPIYGVGVILGLGFYDISALVQFEYTWWMVALTAFFASAVLEYVTSWALEKFFHAYWWDYSDMPLNIKGRICLPASLGFAVAGVLVVYGVAPFFNAYIASLPGIVLESVALVLIVIMSVDATVTITTLTDFQEKVLMQEEEFNERMNVRLSEIYQSSSHVYHATLGRVKGFKLKNVKLSLPKLPEISTEKIEIQFHKVLSKGAKIVEAPKKIIKKAERKLMHEHTESERSSKETVQSVPELIECECERIETEPILTAEPVPAVESVHEKEQSA